MKTYTATILLGTNLGDKNSNIEIAKGQILAICGKIIKTSSIYESAAWGKEDQDSFYNQVLIIKTPYPPKFLMLLLLQIEKRMGRKRKEKWGPRLIDLDMLFYEDEQINNKELIVPHPGIPERRFTLLPLVEIIPDYIHPLLKRDLYSLLLACKDNLNVIKL